MHKAKTFGRSIVCLLICVLFLMSAAAPVSAAMVELEIVREEREFADVHYSASTGSTVIGCLADGTELTIIGEKKNFYRIEHAGMRGYIAKEQVAVDDNEFYYVNCTENSGETRVMEGLTEEEYEETVAQLLSQAEKHIGTRYRYGGARPGGFDCSGYVMYVYSTLGISLNRTASNQLSNGVLVEKEDLQPGDLVFFQGTGSGSIASHVGIYTGDGRFLHASNDGIRYDDLDSDYYTAHYLSARRILVTGTAVYTGITEDTVKTNRNSGHLAGVFCSCKNRKLLL